MSLAGVWQNEYGSLMTLQVDGSAVSGSYQSSTGAVGVYRVVGVQVGADPTSTLGQPVALSIEWHSVANDPADPSWNWSSGLSGQISIQDGEEVLVLAHMMIASTEIPGFIRMGDYIDKLTYKRVPAAASATPSQLGATRSSVPKADDPIAGTWLGEDGISMTLSVAPEEQNRFGYVSGTISLPGGDETVSGVTDINATGDGIDLQSIALTFADRSEALAVSLSGTLNLKTGVLNLTKLRSNATAPTDTYVETRTSAARFTRG